MRFWRHFKETSFQFQFQVLRERRLERRARAPFICRHKAVQSQSLFDCIRKTHSTEASVGGSGSGDDAAVLSLIFDILLKLPKPLSLLNASKELFRPLLNTQTQIEELVPLESFLRSEVSLYNKLLAVIQDSLGQLKAVSLFVFVGFRLVSLRDTREASAVRESVLRVASIAGAARLERPDPQSAGSEGKCLLSLCARGLENSRLSLAPFAGPLASGPKLSRRVGALLAGWQASPGVQRRRLFPTPGIFLRCAARRRSAVAGVQGRRPRRRPKRNSSSSAAAPRLSGDLFCVSLFLRRGLSTKFASSLESATSAKTRCLALLSRACTFTGSFCR